MRTVKPNLIKWRRNETMKFHPTNPQAVFCQPYEYHQWECINGISNYDIHVINQTGPVYARCNDFYEAITLWNTWPAYDVNGLQVPPSSYPSWASSTTDTGYYLETSTCKMRYWDSVIQKYDEDKMWAKWDTDSNTGGAPGSGLVQTWDGGSGYNMQGSQVFRLDFNVLDLSGQNQTMLLSQYVVGSILLVHMGDPLNPSGVYSYTITSVANPPGTFILQVTPTPGAFQSADASYIAGTDVCIKLIWNCNSTGMLLDYPGWPSAPNQQTDLCKNPTLTRYTDTGNWQTDTVIYDDACFTVPATPGWWNNGVYKRYWNGISLGNLVLCGSNIHEHIRYHETNGMASCQQPFVTIYQDANAGPGFSFYHPIYIDAALTTKHPSGFYSDGTIWREWDHNGGWDGNFYSCTQNWAHNVRHRPTGQDKWICNAPLKTIYQTINVLTLGNNTYKPFTDASLQTLHGAQWFACCVQSQTQPQFYAWYWNGSVWTGAKKLCLQEAEDDFIKFTLKVAPFDTENGLNFNWMDAVASKDFASGKMCGAGYDGLDSVNVWQKKTDNDISTNEEGDTVTTDNFSFKKVIYANDEGTSYASEAFYSNAEYFAAWSPEDKVWVPQDVIGTEGTQCSKGCILEGTMVSLPDRTKIKVEELTEGVFVSTKSSSKILKSDKDLELEAFSTSEDITWTDGMELVVLVAKYKVDTLYEIIFNEVTDTLKTSWDHWNLIQRDGTWYYKRSAELVIGDLLPHVQQGITIKEINITFGNFNTYRVDVTGSNLFIANNILTHNASDDGNGGDKKGRK